MSDVIPTFAFEKLSEVAGIDLDELGYDPTDRTFTHGEDRTVVGWHDIDTGDINHLANDDNRPFEPDRVFVVNIENPDLDYLDWLPDVRWKRGKCSNLVLHGDAELRDDRTQQTSNPFFPVPTDATSGDVAKELCRHCPIASGCLQHAVITNEDGGIWGGTGDDERRGLRRSFVKFPDEFASLCDRVTEALANGERPRILRYRNTDGATCGKVSTWNRGCDAGPNGRACKACRLASMQAASRRRRKRNTQTET